MYSKSLPLDVACRVWDVFCRDGEEALFRTGLGILRLYQDVLLQMDFIHSAQFLSRLPENTPAHTLFSCIANTQMISNNRRWNQVRCTHLHTHIQISHTFACIQAYLNIVYRNRLKISNFYFYLSTLYKYILRFYI